MKKAPTKIRVVGLSGSIREGSYTTMAVNVALQGAKSAGAETQLINLRDYNLPLCDGNDDESKYPKDVAKLRAEVQAANGIILGTPEYHGGYSGVLKNALDLMGFDEFEGKMIGLVGVSGGRMGAFTALHSLRDVCRALHAWVIPEQASLPQAYELFDDAGKLKDSNLAERVQEVGRQVTKFASLHNCAKDEEFVKLWQAATANPGGD